MTKLPLLEYTMSGTFRDATTKEQVDLHDVLFMYNTLATKFNEAIEEFENRNGNS